MDISGFYIKDGAVKLNKYKIVVRQYLSLEKTDYIDTPHYVDDEGAEELEVNFVPKHQLMEIVSKDEIDTSDYAWIEGIEPQTNDPQTEVPKIASYGSLEAYEASLEDAADAYMTDLDYRLSMIELGLTD
ncbi:MAG: hypothetical protein LIO53_06980 [Oscillospiraceae bacterium]|nr:hypothetical protein [Oscillospiraceae bacterium]